MNSFDKLLTEISWLYEKGYPDFSIKEDREALYDYLLSIGFPHSDVIELSERFISEKEEKEYTHKGRGIYVKTSDKDNDNAKKYKKDRFVILFFCFVCAQFRQFLLRVVTPSSSKSTELNKQQWLQGLFIFALGTCYE